MFRAIAVVLTLFASPALADECDAIAAGISGATFLHVKKRASYGPFINFDVGHDDLMLACSGRRSLSFTFFGSTDYRFPPPEDLTLFSRAVAAMASFNPDLVYTLSVQCEQKALRDTRQGPGGDTYGRATEPVSDHAHYLICTADHDNMYTFTIAYNDDSTLNSGLENGR